MDDIEEFFILDDIKEFIIVKESRKNEEKEEVQEVKKKDNIKQKRPKRLIGPLTLEDHETLQAKKNRKYNKKEGKKKETVKEKRPKRIIGPLTLEDHEALQAKKNRKYNPNAYQKRKLKLTPEKKAEQARIIEYNKRCRQEKREKEESIKRKAIELLSQNLSEEEISSGDKEILRQAEILELERLKKREAIRRKQAEQRKNCKMTQEQLEASRMKARLRHRRLKLKYEMETSEEREARRLKNVTALYQKKKIEREEYLKRKAMESQGQEYCSLETKNEIAQQMAKKRKIEIARQRRLNYTPEEKKAKLLKIRAYQKRTLQIKRQKEQLLKTKAIELLNQNVSQEEISPEDKEILRKAEILENERIKNREAKKLRFAKQREEVKAARRIKNNIYFKRARQKRREKEDLIKRKATELLSQNVKQEEMSPEDKEILRQAEIIENNRLKKKRQVRNRRYARLGKSPEECETRKPLKQKSDKQRLKTKKQIVIHMYIYVKRVIKSCYQEKQIFLDWDNYNKIRNINVAATVIIALISPLSLNSVIL
ncbi:trichohyalin-like isoform X2 [Eupeodes corollae]|uniref:trichohyalin-like isoform X2 n=1 Tax=Eupeodes corollae TaxID=290404 RepID=UPI0024921462|nr:trichohyalin-like isoform X2 [Eupeodes corollae]